MSAADHIQAAREQELRKREELVRARQELRSALEAGKASGLTLQQLGDLLGVSRQEAHRLIG